MKKVGSQHAYHRGRGRLVVHNATTCSNEPSIQIEEFYRFNLKKLKLRIEVSGLVAFLFVCCVSDPSGVGFQKTLRSWETIRLFPRIAYFSFSKVRMKR